MYGSESYPKDAAINWNLVEKHSYIIGDFVWAAMDYLGEAALGRTFELSPGEPSHQNWPWYNSWCGDIDLCGDKNRNPIIATSYGENVQSQWRYALPSLWANTS